MSHVKGLRCRECSREYSKSPIYVCEFCFGSLEVVYDYDAIRKAVSRDAIAKGPRSLWRYRDLLPVDGEPQAGFHSGWTPLYRARNLEKALGHREIWIKDDSVSHPTCSFKDRVVSVAITKAKEFGFDTVSCASTGNLGNAVSAHGAKAGLKRYIFIPADLERGKVVSSLIYRPTLVAVEGIYDDVNKLCSLIASRYQWAFVNINIRPYYAEGSKTMGYEIAEQLGWRTPAHVVVPVASGSLLTKIHKAFKELHLLGLIDKPRTKVHAAQPKGAAPVVAALKAGTDVITPVRPVTIAKSLAMGSPADGWFAIDTIKQTGGSFDEASDAEIVEGIKLLAETEGTFTETAGGVTMGVARKLIESGRIPKDEPVVICVTGNGLKTLEPLSGDIGKPVTIKPTLDAFEEKIGHKLRKQPGGDG
jgi:threonine synthase